MADDFSQCLVLNIRMAARAVTRRADRKLRPFGVTAAQYTVLTSLRAQPGRSLTVMAHAIAMDRSTLSRNMALLERKGLVSASRTEHSNGRVYILTPHGNGLVDQMLPVWRQAQAELRASLDKPDFPSVLSALQRLSKL